MAANVLSRGHIYSHLNLYISPSAALVRNDATIPPTIDCMLAHDLEHLEP